jgi:hypothetical protein
MDYKEERSGTVASGESLALSEQIEGLLKIQNQALEA